MSSSIEPTLKPIEDALAIKTTRDGRDTVDLRYGIHKGAAEPKRWLVFLNGRTEWLEKYAYVARDLNLPADCGFLTWDHRGQGASGGARSYVDHYDTYAQDSAAIVKEVVGDAPYAMIAHSMGGLIALYSVLKGYLKPKSLVLASPLLGMPHEPVPPHVARPLASLLTACRLGGVSTGSGCYTRIPFETNELTHHAELYRRMQNNPYRIPGATFGWVKATFQALETCYDEAALAKLEVPTLVLGGTRETVVDRDAFHTWVQVASRHAKAEIQLRIVPGAKHELFSEIPEYYEPAVAAVRGWLRDFMR